jgi:hypothetical protein
MLGGGGAVVRMQVPLAEAQEAAVRRSAEEQGVSLCTFDRHFAEQGFRVVPEA